MNRLIEQINFDGGIHLHGITLQNQTLIDFERDRLYRETARQLAGTTISRSYDSQMRLNRIWAHNENMAQAINRQHHYDPAGQLTQIETGQGKHHYRYDSARRLIGAEQPGMEKQAYRFDPAGESSGYSPDCEQASRHLPAART